MDSYNSVGKLRRLEVINSIDQALIDKYGVNLLDAKVSRFDAVDLFFEFNCPLKTADHIAIQQGIQPLGTN